MIFILKDNSSSYVENGLGGDEQEGKQRPVLRLCRLPGEGGYWLEPEVK